MSNLSAPLVRFSTSCANRRDRRSRKSPWSIVPPGNWCEILSVPAVWACTLRPVSASGTAASEPATKRRRDTVMTSSKKVRAPIAEDRAASVRNARVPAR